VTFTERHKDTENFRHIQISKLTEQVQLSGAFRLGVWGGVVIAPTNPQLKPVVDWVLDLPN